MKTLIAGLIFISNFCLAQIRLTDDQISISGPTLLMFADSVSKASELAQMDIDNGMPFILFPGGFSPTYYSIDKDFEKKYSLNFYDFGCSSPQDSLVKAYNFLTFDYLTKKFGTIWIKEVRKDAIGLEDWEKTLK